MKLWSLVRVGCLAVLVTFAASGRSDEAKLTEKFVGKWDATTGPIKGAVFEFGKDGKLKLTVKMGNKTANMEGKYKVASEEIIELTFKGPEDKEKTEKVKYKFDKEDVTLIDPEGNPIKLVKQK
jgi:uncharacterized protein (TIGR03066 family)